MSRTIHDVDLGSTVLIQENGVDVEYILISKDTDSCELLRSLAVVARRMNPTNTTVYAGSEMDEWLSDDTTGFLARFDAATKSAIAMRSISTYSVGDTECHYISRRAYLPSYGQCFLSTPTALEPDKTIIPSLMWNKGTINGSAARVTQGDTQSSAIYWWLRSPYSATNFWFVNGYGNADNFYASNTSNWCRPVLSVASDTIVSDEGAGAINLLPVTEPRKVEFKGLAGTSSVRPAKGIVQYTAQGLDNISVKICNNYGDANPVWVDATAGAEVVFENEAKETAQWQIGVWCYGETSTYNPAYFEEPVVIVEV